MHRISTPIIDIKARWIEAADVERRLRVAGMPTGGNGWPIWSYDADDRAGWDDTARQDALERWQASKVASVGELTRWEECFFIWHMKYVPEDRRELLWAWARCTADVDRRPFSAVCKTKGWVCRTAYQRLETLFANLQQSDFLEAGLLRYAAEKWYAQLRPDQVSDYATVEDNVRDNPPAIPFTNGYQSERSIDLLTTPAAFAKFSQHLADTNEQRRKVRLRRAKAFRGVPHEDIGREAGVHPREN